MRRRVIIGDAVYRQALQAPVEDVFEAVQPRLIDMHDKVLAIKRYLWKKLHSDPTTFLDAMERLSAAIPSVPTIQDAKELDTWAGDLGNLGMKMIDNSEALKRDIPRAQKNVETLEKLRQQAEAKSKVSPDPGYAKVVKVMNGFLKDIQTPVV